MNDDYGLFLVVNDGYYSGEVKAFTSIREVGSYVSYQLYFKGERCEVFRLKGMEEITSEVIDYDRIQIRGLLDEK